MKVEIGEYPDNLEEKRTVCVRIDEYDLWNLDQTLALIILPALQKFRENMNGYPTELSEKQWEDIVDKMISSFEDLLNENVIIMNATPRIQEGLELFGKYYAYLWV